MNKSILLRPVKKLIRKIIVWALSEPGSSIPLWDDLDFMNQYRAKNLPAPVSDNDVVRLADLNAHKNAVPIDHPLRSITRDHLEYPTEDVSLIYLVAIGKMLEYVPPGGVRPSGVFMPTKDWFTDKAVLSTLRGFYDVYILLRWQDINNWYEVRQRVQLVTADHDIRKYINGTVTQLAYEAIDLAGYRHFYLASISGSTIKSFRDQLVTANIVVSDTDLVEGAFGVGDATSTYNDRPIYELSYLKPPASEGAVAQQIVEYPVVGQGTEDNPLRPDIPEDLVCLTQNDVTPDEWEALQNNPDCTTSTGEAGKLANANAVTWGAIDYKIGDPSMYVAIYGGSPSYVKPLGQRIQAITRRKGAKVIARGPFDVTKARDAYRILKQYHKNMVISEDELVYQLTGLAELEPDAVAAFYERELIDLGRIKHVRTEILDRTLDLWIRRARKHKRDKALRKLRRCKKH